MSGSEAMHIGLLQTDSVLSRFQPEFGDYPAMFQRLLGCASQPARFSTYVAQNGNYPAPGTCDAYLITGSRHSVYEPAPWIADLAGFVGAALEADRKVVGICFGHQLLAHFFGGETRAADAGWGVGVHRTRILSREPWMSPPAEEVGLLSSHKDQVVRLPEGARLIAGSSFCPNAGFVMGDRVLTLQGHPEFSKGYAEALMRLREELLGPTTYARGMASLADETHEHIVARWILNFIAW